MRASLALLGLSAGGCLLQLDPERGQCDTDADCESKFGAALGRCIEDYCVATKCSQSAGCGGQALCKVPPNQTEGTCVDKRDAGCSTHEECSQFEGAKVCLPTGNCGRMCNTRQDCTGGSKSATLDCIEGSCVDPIWGCKDEPRPPVTSGVGGFTIVIQGVSKDVDVGPLNLKVCDYLLTDPTCRPIVGAKATYDRTTHVATVTGIPTGEPWRLVVETPQTADPQKRLIPIDYYLLRPIEAGQMFEVKEFLTLVPLELQAVANLNVQELDLKSDTTKASILGRMYNCKGQPAENVRYDIPGRPPGSFDFYFNEQGLPDSSIDHTEASGRGTFVNLTPGAPYTLRAGTAGIEELARFRFAARATTLTQVDLYPVTAPR